jgi:hypothetical protein
MTSVYEPTDFLRLGWRGEDTSAQSTVGTSTSRNIQKGSLVWSRWGRMDVICVGETTLAFEIGTRDKCESYIQEHGLTHQ